MPSFTFDCMLVGCFTVEASDEIAARAKLVEFVDDSATVAVAHPRGHCSLIGEVSLADEPTLAEDLLEVG